MTRVLAVALALLSVSAGAANRSDSNFVTDPGRVITTPLGGGSCPSPPGITSLPFSDSGTTCGSTNSITNYSAAVCTANLNFPYPGEDEAYAITVGASQSLDISADLTGSAGDLALFLIGTCGNGASCLATSQDAIGVGAGPETIPTVSGLAAGTYYVYVDSYYDAGTAGSCGTFTLNVAGTLPVALQSYSID
ncbi:hypothetical protein [Tahibacter caeni]|uniref:hypothetical protein n=1 Tax=Tahibacter caeni TaxID=1453545 RepID=UPI002148E7DB|nr:hypothetical protein [Tahibacter caeni]